MTNSSLSVRMCPQRPVSDIMLQTELDQSDVFIPGVNLDGVCADFYVGIRSIAAEWIGVEETSLTADGES
jgi:hypothetical protein